MKIALSVADRLLIPRLFPQKDSLSNQILVKDIQDKVKLTQEDLKSYEIKEKDGVVMWNKEKDDSKVVELTKMELQLLKDQIKVLDEKKEITQNLVELCLKLHGKGDKNV